MLKLYTLDNGNTLAVNPVLNKYEVEFEGVLEGIISLQKNGFDSTLLFEISVSAESKIEALSCNALNSVLLTVSTNNDLNFSYSRELYCMESNIFAVLFLKKTAAGYSGELF